MVVPSDRSLSMLEGGREGAASDTCMAMSAFLCSGMNRSPTTNLLLKNSAKITIYSLPKTKSSSIKLIF